MGSKSLLLQAQRFVKHRVAVDEPMSRKGTSDTYCYGFEDDGPHANTVLGAVWMTHQASPFLGFGSKLASQTRFQSHFSLARMVFRVQDIIFDMEKNEVGIAAANCWRLNW